MTKQRHCVTKVRLSSFLRFLAGLCLLKLCVVGLLVLDLPQFPGERTRAGKDVAEIRLTESRHAVSGGGAETVPATEEGTPKAGGGTLYMAAVTPSEKKEDSVQAPDTQSRSAALTPGAGLSAANSVNSPQKSPRDPLLAAGQGRKAEQNSESLLDMLGLTHLPIPALGGVRTAEAAPFDMPAPAASQGASPFAPAEQAAPLTMPGAPPIPSNIPRGQGVSGEPLAPRSSQQGMPPLPQAQGGSSPRLTPNITTQTMPEDPNTKAQELARQQQDMLMLRQQMDDRLKDIENAERKMKDMIREAKGLEDKKVRHLILMYANMKPKVAAKAIESLDERVAVRILSGMVPKQSGEILTYTSPEKTAKLTELLTRIRMPEE